MLTIDPRVSADFYRVRSISYEEATEMARCGAKVLHPDSVMPAIRQHIPVVIRNSRNPENEGTRIGPTASGSGIVKGIACRQDTMVLEIRAEGGGEVEPAALHQLCDGNGTSGDWIGTQGNAAFFAVRSTPDRARMSMDGCVSVRVHPCSAILTLVGDRVASTPAIRELLRSTLKPIPATVMSAPQSEHSIVVMVPQSELTRAAALLHREFFGQPDPRIFAPCPPEPAIVTKIQDAATRSAVPVASELHWALGISR
jgi:aspartate kinase